MLRLTAVLAATLVAPCAHADASIDGGESACTAALRRAETAFVADIDGAPDGFTVTRDPDGVRVRYYASLDMCGVYDDYRARTHAGRIGFRVVDDDGHHAAQFEMRFRPALRVCLAAH